MFLYFSVRPSIHLSINPTIHPPIIFSVTSSFLPHPFSVSCILGWPSTHYVVEASLGLLAATSLTLVIGFQTWATVLGFAFSTY